METSDSNLLPFLESDNAFLCNLVDCIPPTVFFNKSFSEHLYDSTHEADQEKPEPSYKSRYSLNNRLTVTKILESQDPKKNKAKNRQKKAKAHRNSVGGGDLHSETLNRASSIDELRQRLTDKIEALRNGRSDAKVVRERHQKVAQRRRLMKKRQTGSGNVAKPVIDDETQRQQSKLAASTSSKPMFNEEGKVVYSKFDFATSVIEEVEGSKKKQESLRGLGGYKVKLKQVEEERKKLEELSETNPEQAEKIKEKAKWKRAIDLAEGVKLKDDPALLKKTIKRREKQKKKSAQRWDARAAAITQKKQERQNKRQENINQRKKQKLDKKLQRLKKKGRLVPGF